jgi:hypothetical protein
MAQQIRRFGVLQTAKVLGVLYALAGLLLAPFFALAALLGADASPLGVVFALFLPALYGVLGFIMTAIGAAIYNAIAGWIGGIEIDLTDSTAL